MKLFSVALVVLTLAACTQPKSSAPAKKATKSSSATQDSAKQTSSQSGSQEAEADSSSANEKKSKQFYYMDTADSFVCSSVAYDNAVPEAKATEGGLKPGSCPASNSLNAEVLVNCSAIRDTDSLSTIQAMIYKKGNDVDGGSVELTKEQGTAICKDMESADSDE